MKRVRLLFAKKYDVQLNVGLPLSTRPDEEISVLGDFTDCNAEPTRVYVGRAHQGTCQLTVRGGAEIKYFYARRTGGVWHPETRHDRQNPRLVTLPRGEANRIMIDDHVAGWSDTERCAAALDIALFEALEQEHPREKAECLLAVAKSLAEFGQDVVAEEVLEFAREATHAVDDRIDSVFLTIRLAEVNRLLGRSDRAERDYLDSLTRSISKPGSYFGQKDADTVDALCTLILHRNQCGAFTPDDHNLSTIEKLLLSSEISPDESRVLAMVALGHTCRILGLERRTDALIGAALDQTRALNAGRENLDGNTRDSREAARVAKMCMLSDEEVACREALAISVAKAQRGFECFGCASAEAWADVADLHIALGERELAIAALETALRVVDVYHYPGDELPGGFDSDRDLTRALIGRGYARLGELEIARDLFSTVACRARIHLYLANIYLDLGWTAEAEELLAEAPPSLLTSRNDSIVECILRCADNYTPTEKPSALVGGHRLLGRGGADQWYARSLLHIETALAQAQCGLRDDAMQSLTSVLQEVDSLSRRERVSVLAKIGVMASLIDQRRALARRELPSPNTSRAWKMASPPNPGFSPSRANPRKTTYRICGPECTDDSKSHPASAEKRCALCGTIVEKANIICSNCGGAIFDAPKKRGFAGPGPKS